MDSLSNFSPLSIGSSSSHTISTPARLSSPGDMSHRESLDAPKPSPHVQATTNKTNKNSTPLRKLRDDTVISTERSLSPRGERRNLNRQPNSILFTCRDLPPTARRVVLLSMKRAIVLNRDCSDIALSFLRPKSPDQNVHSKFDVISQIDIVLGLELLHLFNTLDIVSYPVHQLEYIWLAGQSVPKIVQHRLPHTIVQLFFQNHQHPMFAAQPAGIFTRSLADSRFTALVAVF